MAIFSNRTVAARRKKRRGHGMESTVRVFDNEPGDWGNREAPKTQDPGTERRRRRGKKAPGRIRRRGKKAPGRSRFGKGSSNPIVRKIRKAYRGLAKRRAAGTRSDRKEARVQARSERKRARSGASDARKARRKGGKTDPNKPVKFPYDKKIDWDKVIVN